METLTESAQDVTWEMESPFLADAPRLPVATTAARAFGAATFEAESPFVSEYVSENGAAVPGAQAELFASLLGELYDSEFEEAVTDLVHETSALAEDRFSFEGATPEQRRIETDHRLREYLAPLERESQGMLDRMATGLGETDLRSLTEAELDALLERFAPVQSTLPPNFENFVGKLFKKAKSAVKSAVKVAKKIGALTPHGLILGKLKGLIKPMLERVLKMAIKKLPASLQPIAGQLAKKFLGTVVRESEYEADETVVESAEATAADPADIQREMDTLLAGYIADGESFERQAVVEQFASEATQPALDALAELEVSRDQFVTRVSQMHEGEDPGPVVQQFVPAILPALKLGIKIAGRPKVVNFLAGLVAQLISKYVGQQQATNLSRALVDTGLRLISLETQVADESKQAAYALAATVEETVNHVAVTVPAEARENEALLEMYTRDAFEKAAIANFPDPLIRPELHEAAAAPGAWVMMPSKGGCKRYKKYTQVFDVTITPQMAAAVKSFGGLPLQAILRDQLGVASGATLTARIHLYEAIPGTTLSQIALHEKGVNGLGHARRTGWSLIHPLTPEAAGILLKEPGLGRAAPAQFLADRNRIGVHQRFYYLETRQPVRVSPARGAASGQRPAETTQTSVLLDFPNRQIRLFLYFSENDAQKLAGSLNKRLAFSAIASLLRAGLDVRLTTVLSGAPTRNVKIVHEAVPGEELLVPAAAALNVLRFVGKELAKLLLRWILEAMKRELESRYDAFAATFAKAAAAEADGVTLVISFQQASLLEKLRQWITAGVAGKAAVILGTALAPLRALALGAVSIEIKPGYVRW